MLRLTRRATPSLFGTLCRATQIRVFCASQRVASEQTEWAEEGKPRRAWFGKTPDPTRPRIEDPGQNVGRSYKQFKEDKREQLLSGDQKRKIPLKAIIPEVTIHLSIITVAKSRRFGLNFFNSFHNHSVIVIQFVTIFAPITHIKAIRLYIAYRYII